MSKLNLSNITLLGIDCVNVERLQIAMNVCEKEIEFGASKLLTSLPSDDPRVVHIPHISSIEDFSKFCITDLQKYVETDYVLLVQYDGFILYPQSWTPEFLKYDYIGAPWLVGSWETDDFPESMNGKLIVGNGGFSLRSKKFLETSARLFNEGKITKFHPEDVAMCVWYRDLFEKEGMQFAPPELASLFSIESKTENYGKPFGFHGLYRENIDALKEAQPNFPFYTYLPRMRNKRLEIIQNFFKNIALEGHVFGSLSRGTTDYFSDIDVWITFPDENFSEIIEKRFEYYANIGDIVHLVEPPQNAPVDGVQAFVLYKTRVGLIPVDYSLCPHSTSFITKESKKLFGDMALPLGEIKINPQKKSVPETYRVDFLIAFMFNSIKRIIRKYENPLETLFLEYGYLNERYEMNIPPLEDSSHTFEALEKVIANTMTIATEKQKTALLEITSFIDQVKINIL